MNRSSLSLVLWPLLLAATLASADATRAPTGYPVGPIPGGGAPPDVRMPYEHDAAALADGRRFFVTFNCSGCHGGHAGGGMGPSLRDEDWLYGSTPASVYDSIAAGRAHGMPAWGSRLPPEVIWKLTAYVKSLRTAEEPEPPR